MRFSMRHAAPVPEGSRATKGEADNRDSFVQDAIMQVNEQHLFIAGRWGMKCLAGNDMTSTPVCPADGSPADVANLTG